MTIRKYKIEVFHELAPRCRNLVKEFYVKIDIESDRNPNEFVYARTRLITEGALWRDTHA